MMKFHFDGLDERVIAHMRSETAELLAEYRNAPLSDVVMACELAATLSSELWKIRNEKESRG